MESTFMSNFKIPLKNATSECSDGAIETFSSPLSLCNSEAKKEIIDSTQPPPPTPPPLHLEQPAKRKIPDCEVMFFGRDKTYPVELNALIQPLCCTLCDSKCNSFKSAKLHYESKTHYKHIKNWLTEWAAKNGEPAPKIPKIFKDGPVGPNAFHCQACDLALTSLQHASQHYNGKRHKMVIGNRTNPSGSGYYDVEGKWIRTPTNIKTDHRFGIGESFIPAPPPPPASLPTDVGITLAPVIEPEMDPNRHCFVCKIWVTSDLQMEMHLKGIKHAKKLKTLQLAPYAARGDTILANVNKAAINVPIVSATTSPDVSMYRTPSGCYYCKICNITVTDDSVFLQHLGSKKHAKNSKGQNEKNS